MSTAQASPLTDSVSFVSPQSTTGSMLMAVGVHALIIGMTFLLFGIGVKNHVDQTVMTEEVAYETFSAPPAPAVVAKPVARTKEPETEEKPEPQTDTQPKELQDTQSTITGTQSAAKTQTTTGAEGAGDALATPYYKIKPKYPQAALASGVEGWIALRVDVNEKGEVENIRIIGGQERGMFQDEARRAVSKWKYKPFLDASGKAIKKMDHEVRVDFKLQDAA